MFSLRGKEQAKHNVQLGNMIYYGPVGVCVGTLSLLIIFKTGANKHPDCDYYYVTLPGRRCFDTLYILITLP